MDRDPLNAAQGLLGATLFGRGVAATVVEVEAYGGVPDGPWPDPASHSYRGPNVRNLVMTGPPGRLYTYRSHGIHVCANVVCGPDGVAAAVLLRAGVIIEGVDLAHERRGSAVPARALARGPVICAPRWESRWQTMGLTFSMRLRLCGSSWLIGARRWPGRGSV